MISVLCQNDILDFYWELDDLNEEDDADKEKKGP